MEGAVASLHHSVRPAGVALLSAARLDPEAVPALARLLANASYQQQKHLTRTGAEPYVARDAAASLILGSDVSPVEIRQSSGFSSAPRDTPDEAPRRAAAKVSTPRPTESLTPHSHLVSPRTLAGLVDAEVIAGWAAWETHGAYKGGRGARIHVLEVRLGTGGESPVGVGVGGLEPGEVETDRFVASAQIERHTLCYKYRPTAAEAARFRALRRRGWPTPKRVRESGTVTGWRWSWLGRGVGCRVRALGLEVECERFPDFRKNRKVAESRLMALVAEGAEASGSTEAWGRFARKHGPLVREKFREKAKVMGVDSLRPFWLSSVLELAELF